MYQKTIFLMLWMMAGPLVQAQQAPGKAIRIADSLTIKERQERDPVLLRSELDSLIKLYAPAPATIHNPAQSQPVTEAAVFYLAGGMLLLLLVSGSVLVIVYRQRRLLNKTIYTLREKKNRETRMEGGMMKRSLASEGQAPGSWPKDGPAEFGELIKENEDLKAVIKSYNGIQQEFDALKQGIKKMYKVKNYPGYDKNKEELLAIQNVLKTESAVAEYAYEKFLKPVLAIADSNKNHPSRMSAADNERLCDLLLSLSFFYIEYLYLRVRDLSVGGTMVERIRSLTEGRALRTELLRQLNTESGSRALVLRMALSKLAVKDLTYPVFDETNLNPT